MRKILEIIVHCTATFPDQRVTVADITRWHKRRGWKTIGYHYVVKLDGTVESGRPIEKGGAHCKGHNAYSIGVCYIGGVAADGKTPKDTRTLHQIAALRSLLARLKKEYPTAKIYGHRDFAPKASPSFDAKTEYSDL